MSDSRSVCPICRAQNIRYRYHLYDDRYGAPGHYTLLQCGTCGHGFLDAHFSPKALSDLYSRYYPRGTFDLKGHRPHLELKAFRAWIDGAKGFAHCWVPKGVRVLDIGCGAGEALGYHQSRGCEAYGVEADVNVKRIADAHGYRVRIGAFDPSEYAPGFFDYVTMDQVLEHMPNPVETMQGVARVLKPGGRVVISVPNIKGWGAFIFGRRWVNWHAPYHLHHFSDRSIRLAAAQVKFRVLMSRTVTSSHWLFHQWAHLITLPSESSPSPYWSQNMNLTRWQLTAFRVLGLLHHSGLDHVLSRGCDILGIGDNRLVVLAKAS